jgi:pyruvate/2-oxoacid:ferredoxin oxidoreductase alpha subunit
LTLKFDAIDQINGNGHMLFSEQIQKWVLEELPFVVHDILRVLV